MVTFSCHLPKLIETHFCFVPVWSFHLNSFADVEEYQKSFVCYASRGYMCEAASLSTIRHHCPNAAPITARLDIVAAPAEYCLPIKKDRRFAPEFTIQVQPTTLYTQIGDVCLGR